MSLIPQTITWEAWKFGVLKISMVALGVLLGAYFPVFWSTWLPGVWAVFFVGTAASTIWGFQAGAFHPTQTHAGS